MRWLLGIIRQVHQIRLFVHGMYSERCGQGNASVTGHSGVHCFIYLPGFSTVPSGFMAHLQGLLQGQEQVEVKFQPGECFHVLAGFTWGNCNIIHCVWRKCS